MPRKKLDRFNAQSVLLLAVGEPGSRVYLRTVLRVLHGSFPSFFLSPFSLQAGCPVDSLTTPLLSS